MITQTLKTKTISNIYWGGSSVGEHMAEDHGVESSILSRPIFFESNSRQSRARNSLL